MIFAIAVISFCRRYAAIITLFSPLRAIFMRRHAFRPLPPISVLTPTTCLSFLRRAAAPLPVTPLFRHSMPLFHAADAALLHASAVSPFGVAAAARACRATTRLLFV
jgi:hypothetical protein